MAKFIINGFKNPTVNGDNVIAFTDAKTIKANFAQNDYSTLFNWYKEDPDRNNLGLVELFSNITNYPEPMWHQMLQSNAVITVDGVNGAFTYDVPVATSYEVVTVEDTSTKCGLKPGIEDSVFEIVLNAEFRQNDVLVYDGLNGAQIIISPDIRPRKEGSNWRYFVKLVSNSKVKFFPKEKLRPGIKYWKIGDALGEFSTQYSGITGVSKSGSMRCEFRLGALRGVETSVTRWAGEKSMKYADKYTTYFVDEALRKIRSMEAEHGFKPTMAVIGKQAGNSISSPKVASLMQVFAVAELMKMEAYQLMFQQGGTVQDNNGTININEGLYHAMRRGYRIQYSRPGGLQKEHLRAAADYVFRGRWDLPITKRYIKFKAGAKAYANVVELFKDEFYRQLNAIGNFMGTDMMLPKNPITGSLDALVLNPIAIKSVYLPGIGMVDIEHDPSLDYVDLVDRTSLIDGSVPITSYSLILEDVTDPTYSNAFVGVPNTATAKVGNINNNVFYVKPEGPSVYWGMEKGRWSSESVSGLVDACSSMKTMAENFWCNSSSAVWVRDNSKFILIEMAH